MLSRHQREIKELQNKEVALKKAIVKGSKARKNKWWKRLSNWMLKFSEAGLTNALAAGIVDRKQLIKDCKQKPRVWGTFGSVSQEGRVDIEFFGAKDTFCPLCPTPRQFFSFAKERRDKRDKVEEAMGKDDVHPKMKKKTLVDKYLHGCLLGNSGEQKFHLKMVVIPPFVFLSIVKNFLRSDFAVSGFTGKISAEMLIAISELLGWVKDVFQHCAPGWDREVLMKESDCVRRIFHGNLEIEDAKNVEGKVTLADALVYACKQGVDKVVDLAMLTGACVVALGNDIAGMFTPNDEMSFLASRNLSHSVGYASLAVGTEVSTCSWLAVLLSVVARVVIPLRNYSSVELLILVRRSPFVDENVKWLHIDMDGPFWSEKKRCAMGFGIELMKFDMGAAGCTNRWRLCRASKIYRGHKQRWLVAGNLDEQEALYRGGYRLLFWWSQIAGGSFTNHHGMLKYRAGILEKPHILKPSREGFVRCTAAGNDCAISRIAKIHRAATGTIAHSFNKLSVAIKREWSGWLPIHLEYAQNT
eukprot:Gb_18595 [translate_table: standard]